MWSKQRHAGIRSTEGGGECLGKVPDGPRWGLHET